MKLIEQKYEEVKEKVQEALKETSIVALTADVWTSIATESYLGVTCHFLAEDWQMKSYTLTTKLLTRLKLLFTIMALTLLQQ